MKHFTILVPILMLLTSCTIYREGPFVQCIEQVPYQDSATLYLTTPVYSYHSLVYDVTEHDVLPHNTPKQNSDAIKTFFAGFPPGASPVVRIPAGDYHFDTTLTLPEGIAPRLIGDNGSAFAPGSTRLVFHRGSGVHVPGRNGGTVLEHLYVIGAHPESQYWANGGKTGISNLYGFHLQSQTTVLHCSARNFDYGFYTWANLSSEGTNASSSLLLGCHALENRVDGFIAGIEDANVIAYINCDARDNGGVGFHDFSFLGNNYISCMTHNNRGGGYRVRDLYNSRSTFTGCYSEEGQAPSQLRPRSVIVGGLWGSGYKINDGPIIYK